MKNPDDTWGSKLSKDYLNQRIGDSHYTIQIKKGYKELLPDILDKDYITFIEFDKLPDNDSTKIDSTIKAKIARGADIDHWQVVRRDLKKEVRQMTKFEDIQDAAKRYDGKTGEFSVLKTL